MTRHTGAIIGGLLVGSCAAGAMFWQWHHPPRPPVMADKPAPNMTPLPPLIPFRLPPAEAFEDIGTRPLFIATRRPEPPPPPDEPPPPPPVVEKAPAAPELKWQLFGVMITPHRSIALLRPDEPQAKTARVVLGDRMGDWRLESVLPGRVVLKKGDKTQELTLVRPKKAGGRRSGSKGAAAVNAAPAVAPNTVPATPQNTVPQP